MEIFPVQYSTLSSSALQKYLAGSYGVPVNKCKYLLRGVSDTYVVHTDNDKYIFKIYRDSHRSFNEIAGEVELLNLLKNKGAKVAWPVADRDGNYIQPFNAPEGIRHGVLFIFAPGKNIVQPGERELNTIGFEMARIHNITSAIELQYPRGVYDIETTLIKPFKVIEPAFADFPEGYTYLKDIASRVINKMAGFDAAKFSYGYCHYDMLPKNFHFDEDGNITFFDFDFAGKGYLVNDLMTLYFNYFWLVYYQKMTAEHAQTDFNTFVAAYRRVRPLSGEELAAIPCLGIMFLIFFLQFQYENYDDMTNYYFNTRFLKERVDMIKKWVEWYWVE
jgi:Ser/Thr protein kinase RdoA (MazF antagonist)